MYWIRNKYDPLGVLSLWRGDDGRSGATTRNQYVEIWNTKQCELYRSVCGVLYDVI